jgi:alpha-galactosidase
MPQWIFSYCWLLFLLNEERMKQGDANAPENRTDQLSDNVTRRSFLRAGAAGIGSLTAASSAIAFTSEERNTAVAKQESGSQAGKQSPRPSSFLDLIRAPDAVSAFQRFEQTLPTGSIPLQRRGEHWTGQLVEVETRLDRDILVLTLRAPSTPIALVHVRWHVETSPKLKVLGDAWERSYGELGWRNIIPERVMPWYFATFDGESCHGYGVKTDARALCFWQLDPQGVSLWLNTTNGGSGVELGQRPLTMATVVTRRGANGEDAVDSVAALCKAMCSRTTRPILPIYGANDWCYSYGQSTAESILRDTEFIVEVSPASAVWPFSVIDGGWSNGTAAWPDMGKLAGEIKRRNARPGIWVRPLDASGNSDQGLLLPGARFGNKKDRASEVAYDPTVPEAREEIRAKLRQAVEWGYEMVKHDFSTYDLLGQWGFEMGPQPTLAGWSLHDRSRTNAEVIADLYALIREGVGDRVVIDGCNTVGHLCQGVFDLQRIGDDTSGHQWERTRRMGVNTLSFRLPQNGTFFTVDPDLVGLTEAIPWEFNRQWLDLLARSGAATIVSSAPTMRGREQQGALREAFQIASTGGVSLKPVDWMETSTPEHWRATRGAGPGQQLPYQWSGTDGAAPFLSP